MAEPDALTTLPMPAASEPPEAPVDSDFLRVARLADEQARVQWGLLQHLVGPEA